MQVKPRFTSWFLALLLAVATPFGVPVSRIEVPAYGIVSIYRAKDAQRQSEQRPVIAVSKPRLQAALPGDDLPRPVTLLDQSLFQRPPPEPLA